MPSVTSLKILSHTALLSLTQHKEDESKNNRIIPPSGAERLKKLSLQEDTIRL